MYVFICDVIDFVLVEYIVKDILGCFDYVDYLVNNVGWLICCLVVNFIDWLYDYEWVMVVNYFGVVCMVLVLLLYWCECWFGYVVNVFSVGV